MTADSLIRDASTDKLLLVILSSASGTGKTTLWRKLLADGDVQGLHVSISHTTRSPRGEETDGEDYHFVGVEQFERMIEQGEFAEYARVHGNLYGTSVREVQRIADLPDARGIVFDIDVQGARQLQSRYPHACSVFILPPSIQELERRLRGRGTETEDQLKLRLENAMDELRAFDQFEYIVINDDLESAYTELRTIIEAHPLRSTMRDGAARALLDAWHEGDAP